MKKIDEQFQRIKVSLHLQAGSISVHVTNDNISKTYTGSSFPDTSKQSTQGSKYVYFPKNIAMYETDKTWDNLYVMMRKDIKCKNKI